jgi:ABC-2 type transport system ATP-binding protein
LFSVAARVRVRDLRKRYGNVEAVRGVTFEIGEGETFGLLGPNGAGKTTTIECVIGLREPDSGSIEVCGLDARKQPREVKQKIGAALQTTSLQDKITAREALNLFGAFYRSNTSPDTLLARFGMAEKADAPFDSLSGGQKQRLALALAFVNSPELVFLDEPTAGLDPQSRRELHGAIAQMKEDGHTVLLTTHALDEAEALCDRIAVIHRGMVVATGSPRDLVAGSHSTPSVALTAAQPLDRAWLADVPGIANLDVQGTTVHFRTEAVTRTLSAVTHALDARGIEIVDLHVQKATLEDVFLELTNEQGS